MATKDIQKTLDVFEQSKSSHSARLTTYLAYLQSAYEDKQDEFKAKLAEADGEYEETFVVTDEQNPISLDDTQYFKVQDGRILFETVYTNEDGVQADAFELEGVKTASLKISCDEIGFKLFDSHENKIYHEKIQVQTQDGAAKFVATIKDFPKREGQQPPSI